MNSLLKRFLRWLTDWPRPGRFGLGLMAEPGGDPGSPRDPYSRKPAPVRTGPKSRSGAVAVAEPDE